MDYSELSSIRPSKWEMLNQEDKRNAEHLTTGENWSNHQFKQAMIELSRLGIGIPSYNRPESFDIGGIKAITDELAQRTSKNGREHARLLIADWGARRLLIHKDTYVGSAEAVTTELTKQPGRERYQTYAGLLHTHPIPKLEENSRQHLNFSGQDYRSLFANDEMLFILARYNQENLIAMKTTATPNFSKQRLDSIITDLEREFLTPFGPGTFTQKAIKFTKHVCLETGLVLYRTSPNNSIARRESVTS